MSDEEDKFREAVREWLAFLVSSSTQAEVLADRFAQLGQAAEAAGAASLAGFLLGTAQGHYKLVTGRSDCDEVDEMHRMLTRPNSN